MISDDQLDTLINILPFAAHVRMVDTGKYILANRIHALNQGFSDLESVIGLTHKDIYSHRRNQIAGLEGSLVLEDQYREFIKSINVQADHTEKPLQYYVCTLFPTGFIYSGVLKKVPLLGHKNNTVAILTFSEERTHDLSLFDLYTLYKKHYPTKQAIMQFLRYLRIERYFQKLPTNQELTILLLLRKSSISKQVASELSISYRTVEEYKARLRSKITIVTLNGLLVLLRMHREKPFPMMNGLLSVEQMGLIE